MKQPFVSDSAQVAVGLTSFRLNLCLDSIKRSLPAPTPLAEICMFAGVSRSVVAVSCCAPRLVPCCTFTKKPATLLLLRSLPHTLLYQHQRPHSITATMASAATSTTGAATSATGSAAPRLVVHFDVNQTVIFTDEVPTGVVILCLPLAHHYRTTTRLQRRRCQK